MKKLNRNLINTMNNEYYEKILDKQVAKLNKIFKYNLKEDVLYELMIGLIDEAPEEIHQHLFIKFTYMLGEKLKIDKKIIAKEIIKN